MKINPYLARLTSDEVREFAADVPAGVFDDMESLTFSVRQLPKMLIIECSSRGKDKYKAMLADPGSIPMNGDMQLLPSSDSCGMIETIRTAQRCKLAEDIYTFEELIGLWFIPNASELMLECYSWVTQPLLQTGGDVNPFGKPVTPNGLAPVSNLGLEIQKSSKPKPRSSGR